MCDCCTLVVHPNRHHAVADYFSSRLPALQISGILEQQKEAKSAEAAAAAGGGAKKKVVSGGGAGKAGGDDKKDGDEEDDGLDPETKKLHASLSHAILVERPNVKWSDVAGLDTAKQLTKETVLMPMMFPQLFTGNRKPWRGLLFYGPPGTGKSHLARAVATEVKNATFFSVSSSDLVSKYQGESERLVRGLWELARKKKPSIIFIDEIDALCSARKDGDNDATTRIKTEVCVLIAARRYECAIVQRRFLFLCNSFLLSRFPSAAAPCYLLCPAFNSIRRCVQQRRRSARARRHQYAVGARSGRAPPL